MKAAGVRAVRTAAVFDKTSTIQMTHENNLLYGFYAIFPLKKLIHSLPFFVTFLLLSNGRRTSHLFKKVCVYLCNL